MVKYYTGVGSRETPDYVCRAMTVIASNLEMQGYILRSGGADGADTAFELGTTKADIYLPWKLFNKHPSTLYGASQDAIDLAMSVHPAPDQCNQAARKLHGRNAYQVLGSDLFTPSEFVVAWTVGGQYKGGTRTAIVLAEKYSIPVLNLGKLTTYQACLDKFEVFYAAFG